MRKELGLIGDITIEEDYKYGMKKIATLLMLNLWALMIILIMQIKNQLSKNIKTGKNK